MTIRGSTEFTFVFTTEAEGWAYFWGDEERAISGLPARVRRLLGVE